MFTESHFPELNSIEIRQNFCGQNIYYMKHNISFWNQSSKSLNVFSKFLARVVHVSIGSRVESCKTVFGRLTLWSEYLLGLKAITLFQAFSASISTVIIDPVVRIYVQPCGMSLEYIPCWQAEHCWQTLNLRVHSSLACGVNVALKTTSYKGKVRHSWEKSTFNSCWSRSKINCFALCLEKGRLATWEPRQF